MLSILHATLLTWVTFQRIRYIALAAFLSVWLGFWYVDKPTHLSQDASYTDGHIYKQNV